MEKYIDFRNGIEYDKLKEVASLINDGGIVIFPTETVYGIGGDAFNEKSVEKIYELKNRPKEKAISLLVGDLSMIDDLAVNVSETERKIIENFFPGPLTIILKKSKKVPDIVTAGFDTVGVRMPENEIALKLIREVGKPLATPSANISGKPSGTEYSEIIKDFDGKIDCFIDGGKTKIGFASTIVKVENGEIKILREGKITKEDIEKVLGK